MLLVFSMFLFTSYRTSIPGLWLIDLDHFQIAGLTNNSYIAESHEVRACIRKHPALGDSVLDVAKRRLDHMLYVGLTEDHKESATAFAHVVGAQVISQLVGSNSSMSHLATNLTDFDLCRDEAYRDLKLRFADV
ncbi:hypothetical protein KSS87_005342 [Heliosperma pusillum]|nr:hypothetical protein KSS87_005342 [Heliosperma pusillum]